MSQGSLLFGDNLNTDTTVISGFERLQDSEGLKIIEEGDTVPSISATHPSPTPSPSAQNYAYFRQNIETRLGVLKPQQTLARKQARNDNNGKRWVRRKENDRFTGNPHIVTPAKDDLLQSLPYVRTTFPSPLPAYLSRNTRVSSGTAPIIDEHSSMSGLFSLGLKGVRRELRKSGDKVKNLVVEVEDEILTWLDGGTLLSPMNGNLEVLDAPGNPIGRTGKIFEIHRDPLRMVWYIENDGFIRYIIHCCARYHRIVSFSKEHTGRRLTHLLRPNVLQANRSVLRTIDTPPPTDFDSSVHGLDTDIDSLSVSDMETISEAAYSEVFEHLSRPPSALSEWSENEANQTFIQERTRSSYEQSYISSSDREADVEESDLGNDLSESISSLTFREPNESLQQSTDMWEGRLIVQPILTPPQRATATATKFSTRRIPLDRQARLAHTPFYDYLFA